MSPDVTIGAPLAVATAKALGGDPELERQVLQVSLKEQELAAETAMRVLASLIRYIQAREGLPFEAVVELPRELVTQQEDVKVQVVEKGGAFQITLKEIR